MVILQQSPRPVRGQQHGSGRSRYTAEHTPDLEGISQCAGRTAAGLLLGVATTFPSLDHDCMWKVLEEMNLSVKIVRSVRLHYHQRITDMTSSTRGRVVSPRPFASGIKQGCPLSGTCFVLTLDPLIRHDLLATPLPSSAMCACAAGLGLVILNMFVQFPNIEAVFTLWVSATGLGLKGPKQVLIPLFPDFQDIVPWATTGDRGDLCVRLWWKFWGSRSAQVRTNTNGLLFCTRWHRVSARPGLDARVCRPECSCSTPTSRCSSRTRRSSRPLQPLSTSPTEMRPPWQSMPSEILTDLKSSGTSGGHPRPQSVERLSNIFLYMYI